MRGPVRRGKVQHLADSTAKATGGPRVPQTRVVSGMAVAGLDFPAIAPDSEAERQADVLAAVCAAAAETTATDAKEAALAAAEAVQRQAALAQLAEVFPAAGRAQLAAALAVSGGPVAGAVAHLVREVAAGTEPRPAVAMLDPAVAGLGGGDAAALEAWQAGTNRSGWLAPAELADALWEASGEGTDWACEVCTLLNPAAEASCAACATMRLDAEAKKKQQHERGICWEEPEQTEQEGTQEEEEEEGEEEAEISQLARLFDGVSAAATRRVWEAAGSAFEPALDALLELAARAEASALTVDGYLGLLGQQLREGRELEPLPGGGAADSERLQAAVLGKLRLPPRPTHAETAKPPGGGQRGHGIMVAARTAGGGADDASGKPLDLHGCSVQDALDALFAALEHTRQLGPRGGAGGRRWRRLVVISGRGAHSGGAPGWAPLRRAVAAKLTSLGLRFTELHGGGAFAVKVPVG
jgi:hypothetical protein